MQVVNLGCRDSGRLDLIAQGNGRSDLECAPPKHLTVDGASPAVLRHIKNQKRDIPNLRASLFDLPARETGPPTDGGTLAK